MFSPTLYTVSMFSSTLYTGSSLFTCNRAPSSYLTEKIQFIRPYAAFQQAKKNYYSPTSTAVLFLNLSHHRPTPCANTFALAGPQ